MRAGVQPPLAAPSALRFHAAMPAPPDPGPLDQALLPPGLRGRRIDGLNGLSVHVLEAGVPQHPLVLLLHGFPELAYSWRRIMPGLAAAGFHVAAPDLRGFGRTTGWDAAYDTDLAPFGLLNLVRDAMALVTALGHRRAAMVVGHDAGSSVAALCALARPDLFPALVLMSAPFAGPPAFPPAPAPPFDMPAALATLDPPRQHYQWYYATRGAEADMRHPPQGLHSFLRAYYHHKSADWPGNDPHPLPGLTAEVLATLPAYYIMPAGQTMPQAVAPTMPPAAPAWLPDGELAVYAAEYERTGFQGGLNWYRGRIAGLHASDLATFAGRRIEVPAHFIAGRQDWGIYQSPGAFEAMMHHAFAHPRGAHLIEGAGHWVQQERPEAVLALLLEALHDG